MKCPYCAEEIQDEAIVCRHCGRDFILTKPLYERLKILEDKLRMLEGDFLELSGKIDAGAISLQDKKKHNTFRVTLIELFLYAFISTPTNIFVLPQLPSYYIALLASFSIPLLLGLFFGYKWGSRNLLTLGFLMLILSVLLMGIRVTINDYGTEHQSSSYRYDLIEIIEFPIVFVFIIGNTLLLISSAFIGDRIFRRLNPDTRRIGLAGKVAQSIAGRARTHSAVDRAEMIKSYLLAFAPILTLIGTIIGAVLTFLGTIFRPK